MREDAEVPVGWCSASISEVSTDVVVGYVGPVRQHYVNGGIPFLMGKNIKGGELRLIDLERVSPGFHRSQSKSALSADDVVVVRIGRSGEAAVVPESLGLANCGGLVVIKRPIGVTSSYLAAFLNSPQGQEQSEGEVRGVTRKTLNTGSIAAAQVPLPPLREQRRIVTKLEALTAKSRRAKEVLDAIPPLLERFRQSVLASAFRGDLTAAWRAKNPDVEPADKLLARIRIERRRRWEEAELTRMQAKGKTPGDDRWKEKYEEPEPVDTEGLPELPEGWTWARLPECGAVARGKSRHRPRNDPALFGGVYPFVQTGDVAQCGGRLRSYTQTYNDVGLAQSRLFPAGTVCITIAANIANSCVLEIDACFPDSVVGVDVDRRVMTADYLELYLRLARTNIAAFAPGTAQKNINLDILGDLAVPVPPVEERKFLEELIQMAFRRVSNLETLALESHAHVAALARSILAKAFRGELVPQDPSDEPASVLLERIRAERAAASPTKEKKPSKRK